VAWPKESWESLATSGLFSVDYLISLVLEPLKGYVFIDEPPWALYQLRFVESAGAASLEIAVEEAFRGPFEDRDALGTLSTVALSDPIVGVLLASQVFSFAVGRAPIRVATRILVYANEMAFEGHLIEDGEAEMVIGSNQPSVVEALSALLRRSDCFVLPAEANDNYNLSASTARTADIAGLLRSQGFRRLTFKGRNVPAGEVGTFVHYLDVVDGGTLLWENGDAPDRTDTETYEEDLHEVVFKSSYGAGYYLVYTEGFVEYVALGAGHRDETLVEMGQWLSEHPDEE